MFEITISRPSISTTWGFDGKFCHLHKLFPYHCFMASAVEDSVEAAATRMIKIARIGKFRGGKRRVQKYDALTRIMGVVVPDIHWVARKPAPTHSGAFHMDMSRARALARV